MNIGYFMFPQSLCWIHTPANFPGTAEFEIMTIWKSRPNVFYIFYVAYNGRIHTAPYSAM